MSEKENKVPHVLTAVGEVLKKLQVDKNGKLPSNMGSGAYIQAHDVTAEVKRQFVEQSLIFIPDETVISQEHVVFKERLNIRVIIKGSYQIISTVDGSSLTIHGTGDGLAVATAVSSNIASTNAVKNALLRTFLITEQSAEEMAKSGTDVAEKTTPVANKVAQAKKVTSKAKQGDNQAKIIQDWIKPGTVDKDSVNTLYGRVKVEKPGLKGDAIFGEVLARLEKGEVG